MRPNGRIDRCAWNGQSAIIWVLVKDQFLYLSKEVSSKTMNQPYYQKKSSTLHDTIPFVKS